MKEKKTLENIMNYIFIKKHELFLHMPQVYLAKKYVLSIISSESQAFLFDQDYDTK